MVKVGISFVSAAGAAANLVAEDPGWNFAAVAQCGDCGVERPVGPGGRPRRHATPRSASSTPPCTTPCCSLRCSATTTASTWGSTIGCTPLSGGHVQYSKSRKGTSTDPKSPSWPSCCRVLPPRWSSRCSTMRTRPRGASCPSGSSPTTTPASGTGIPPTRSSPTPTPTVRASSTWQHALKPMIHGATVPESGFVDRAAEPRPSTWPTVGCPQLTYDITSYPYTDGGSETLEYSVDDFSISQLARRRPATRPRRPLFAKRGQNWQNLFNPATGYLAARQADGSFPAGPAFQPASPADQAQGVAQQGFEEGNAIQYTWAVPQNLAGLFGLMGGDRAAVAKLDTFFTRLDATRFAAVRLGRQRAGGVDPLRVRLRRAPCETQSVVRRIMTQLYPLAPVASRARTTSGPSPRGTCGRRWASTPKPRGGRPGHDQPPLPPGEGHRGQWPHAHHHRLRMPPTPTSACPTGDRVGAGPRRGTSRGSLPRPSPRGEPRGGLG